MANKLLGNGCKLYYESATPGTYVEVVDVVSISYEFSVPDVDVTVLSSTAREFKPGLVDGGTVNFQLRFDPDAASHDKMQELGLAKTTLNWKVSYSDATPTDHIFSGYINKYAIGGVEVDGSVTLDGSLKVTGLPTLT